jgi:hypothetical protein
MVSFNVSLLPLIWNSSRFAYIPSQLPGLSGELCFLAQRTFPSARDRLLPAQLTVQSTLERVDDKRCLSLRYAHETFLDLDRLANGGRPIACDTRRLGYISDCFIFVQVLFRCLAFFLTFYFGGGGVDLPSHTTIRE